MKRIILALYLVGKIAIIFATGYFIQLYTTFTQLILSLGIAGFGILAGFLYIYNWIQNKDEEGKDRDEAMDHMNMYMREIDEKIEKKKVF